MRFSLTSLIVLTLAAALVYLELMFTGTLLAITLFVAPTSVMLVGLTAPSGPTSDRRSSSSGILGNGESGSRTEIPIPGSWVPDQ
ncbi:MAG: hypothetical protein AAGC97_09615 [Planctomycetota bacterium]